MKNSNDAELGFESSRHLSSREIARLMSLSLPCAACDVDVAGGATGDSTKASGRRDASP
ncbi:MAG: hypothetical protein OXE85_03305 [Roseovarius sp.]|nr:hypothetical protein [Roseovarius sp.]